MARRGSTGTIDIPAGLARPRLRITTTGHATDGAGGNEFVSSDHILRIDGQPVAPLATVVGGRRRPASGQSVGGT